MTDTPTTRALITEEMITVALDAFNLNATPMKQRLWMRDALAAAALAARDAEIAALDLKLVAILNRFGFATGHGDTLTDLLGELEAHVVETFGKRDAEIAALKADKARMGEAPKPSAAWTEAFEQSDLFCTEQRASIIWGDDKWFEDPSDRYQTPAITYGDLRRAHSALKEPS